MPDHTYSIASEGERIAYARTGVLVPGSHRFEVSDDQIDREVLLVDIGDGSVEWKDTSHALRGGSKVDVFGGRSYIVKVTSDQMIVTFFGIQKEPN
jgi:hypothetical protein